MIYLSFIYHMHQPYYKNLLTSRAELPWVRLHGTKDYLDMALLLDEFPKMHQTFNVVPSLLEQVEDYASGKLTDIYQDLSYKSAAELTQPDKNFIRDHFFSADLNRVVAVHPRYYDLFLRRHTDYEYSEFDWRDLQVWFNLVWMDPEFRHENPELRAMVKKGRYFTEDEKRGLLDFQRQILSRIIPTYKRLQDEGKMEVSVTPYFHPILPLLFSSFAAQDANPQTPLPRRIFSHPEDAVWHVQAAVDYYVSRFGSVPVGMWPSEEAVSPDIIPMLIQSGLRWIVTDETLLWKTVKHVQRDGRILYRPYKLKMKENELTVIFRDKYLSDLIGFEYQHWRTKDAVDNFMHHLEKIRDYFGTEDCFVPIALDGENAWEYYRNDGRDFLRLLYGRISETPYVKAVTVKEYLKDHCVNHHLPTIATGSWIFGDLNKWMGHPAKNLAWDYLSQARDLIRPEHLKDENIMRQIHVLEGSDWFWWYGDKQADFDELYRLHLRNLYHMLGVACPAELNMPIDK